MARTSDAARSPWRYGVPVVCLLAGLLLAATHGVSGGAEIRGSDSPRLVDMVREAQAGVERLNAQRDALVAQIDSTHGRSSNVALAAMQARADDLAAGLGPMRGPGLVVTLTDAQRDANGRFPRDAAPDDLVVHQQDVQAVLNALWSAGAEAIHLFEAAIAAAHTERPREQLQYRGTHHKHPGDDHRCPEAEDDPEQVSEIGKGKLKGCIECLTEIPVLT